MARAAASLEDVLRRSPDPAPTAQQVTEVLTGVVDTRRARDRAVAAANRWAASQPRAGRSETQQVLDAWAAQINDACRGRGSAVQRIGRRLHAPAGLRMH